VYVIKVTYHVYLLRKKKTQKEELSELGQRRLYQIWEGNRPDLPTYWVSDMLLHFETRAPQKRLSVETRGQILHL